MSKISEQKNPISIREFWASKNSLDFQQSNLELIDLYLTNLQKNFELICQINTNLKSDHIEIVLEIAEKWWIFHMDLIGQ